AIEMARRSKLKRQRLYWFRRMETLSKLVVSAENFEEAFSPVLPGVQAGGSSGSGDASSGRGQVMNSGVLLSRNVSIPYLLRQLGGSKADPPQKSRRIPGIDNVQREILQMSYDILGEDEQRFDTAPAEGPGHKERAMQLYGKFSEKEKLALLNQKIDMLKKKQALEAEKGGFAENITTRLLDELEAVKKAVEEGSAEAELKAAAKASRGADPKGLPAYTPGARGKNLGSGGSIAGGSGSS
ncbi:unnamed protein product, partial [Polarella glacialis]